MAAIEALAELILDYIRDKTKLPEQWFEIDEAITQDPDFVSLAPSALNEIRETRLWFEVKIMRQYLALMNQTVPESRDVANMIALDTQRILLEKTGEPLQPFIERPRRFEVQGHGFQPFEAVESRLDPFRTGQRPPATLFLRLGAFFG